VNSKIPSDILSFIQVLKANHVEVTGPIRDGDRLVFRVNDHSLTEDELRFLSHENCVTSWDVYAYVKRRAETRDV
jgi:hypothetical protein